MRLLIIDLNQILKADVASGESVSSLASEAYKQYNIEVSFRRNTFLALAIVMNSKLALMCIQHPHISNLPDSFLIEHILNK